MTEKLCIIGMGYVGLPLAIEYGKNFKTLGFDINKKRINELNNKIDVTGEIDKENFELSKNLSFCDDENLIIDANVYIIAVPTPVDKNNIPDLRMLKEASSMVGKKIKKNDTIIYESTVFPGATEEICIPILEKYSNLKFKVDFGVGYSPERINPGDKKHSLVNITKVVSGSSLKVLNKIDNLYSCIIKAGTYRAESIKVAEAAKVIENIQRDLNIALINELSIIFKKFNLDTESVLNAASTKWNFLSFKPGIVGGHCIGVDPYYLTYKSEQLGYKPRIILAGRNLNDEMPEYIAKTFSKKMRRLFPNTTGNKVLILGFTFKENCSDIRNTQVLKIVRELESLDYEIDVYDPYVDNNDVKELKINFIKQIKKSHYKGLIIAVGHDVFFDWGHKKINSFLEKENVIYDLKYVIDRQYSTMRL